MKTLKSALLLITISIATLSFAQNNTLPTSGNIGIGTLNPSAKLDVNGQMIVDSLVILKDSLYVQKKVEVGQDMKVKGKSTFIDNGKFKAELKVLGVAKMKDKLVVDGLTKMNGDAKIFGGLNLKGLEDLSLTANRLLTIQPNGLVQGINISGLQEFLQIATCFVNEDGTVSSGWVRKSNPVYGILHTGDGCPTRVGIGTQNPLAPLHVTGKGIFGSVETGAGGVKVVVPNVSTLKAYSVLNNVTNQDVFRVMSDGHVWCTELDIKLKEDFPDYVFAKDYSLMPLEELESYISKNKHLPNIPSAEEVAKDGLSVGEMQVKQMEKIEEITLYLIALKKEIDAVKKENTELKKLVIQK